VLPLFTAVMGFALGGSFVWAIDQPKYGQHINNAETHTVSGANEHQPPQTLRQRLSAIWKRTWDEPVAFYTFVLSIFTALLAFISLIQIGFLFRTDKTARVAANAADLNARAAIGVELPIIIIDRMNLVHIPGVAGSIVGALPEKVKPIVVLKNIGRTAAELTSGCIEANVFERLPETPVYKHIFSFVPGTLLIEDGRYQIPFNEYTVTLDSNERHAVAAEARFFWLYGFLKYQDFLGFPHEVRFCARWEAVNASGQPRGFVLDTNTPKAYLQRS
jgi:hypothetical protein